MTDTSSNRTTSTRAAEATRGRGLPEGGLSPEGLEELVASHGALIYRLAAAIVHDHALAEDVVQDVIIKAWHSLPTQGGDVTTRWLRTVTRNTAIDLLRRRRFDDFTREPHSHTSREPSTDRIVESRQHLEALWAALAGLDPDARTMLVLHETEGLTYDEVADLLGTTPSAVKAKLYRARHTLRQQLKEWE